MGCVKRTIQVMCRKKAAIVGVWRLASLPAYVLFPALVVVRHWSTKSSS